MLTAHAAEWQNVLTTQLHADATKQLNQIMANFEAQTTDLTTPPDNLDQLPVQLNKLAKASSGMPELRAQYGPLRDKFSALTSFDAAVRVNILLSYRIYEIWLLLFRTPV